MPGQFLKLGEYAINFDNVTYIKLESEGRIFGPNFHVYFIGTEKPIVIKGDTTAGKALSAWLKKSSSGESQEH